jgi:putative tryptophan/tyrosine transport system substrate-binding protein
MRRGDFIALLGGAAAVASRPHPAFTQTPSKRPLIAAQLGGSKTGTDRFFGGFSQGMRELGYVEGQDYGFEVRHGDGNVSRIPPQIEELVRLKPDIIVSGTTAGVIAAKKLSNTVPIVCADLTNPIEFGLAASYARPGGNVTGVLVTVEDLPTKLLALAVEVIPGAKKIGLLIHSDNPIQPALQRSLDASVNALGVELTVFEIASAHDLHAAFQRLARERVKVVLMLGDFLFLNERKRIALFAMAERLPTVFAFRENVEDGGLMSYGTDLRESWRRTTAFVDKILKGTKPGDLPIEFPTKLELVINLTTAEALGLTIAPALLARADEVIE